MNRIKITKNRVVACFAAILLLLPATVGAQHFDAHIAGSELIKEFADFVEQVDKSREAVKKSLEKTQQLYDSLMQEYFG